MKKKFYNLLIHFKNERRLMQRATMLCCVVLFGFITLAQAASPQEGKLDLNLGKTTFKKVFAEIQKQTGYIVMFNNAMLDKNESLDLNVEDAELKDVLQEILKEKGLVYKVKDEFIIIEKDKSAKPDLKSEQEKKKISGTVVDEKGVSLPGVSVFVKGTTIGVITAIDGTYIIESPVRYKTLSFSFIGMKTQEVAIDGRNELNITLVQDAQGLDEVMVVGFGKQKKASVIASINTVKPSDLKVPTSSLSSTLAGRLSGVIAVQRSGEPGADGADFWIRGVSTFGANRSPLILVDGIEVSSSDLNDMDPENIENFSILKDASATALYGVQGGNGVVLITTKVGQISAKPKISVRIENSITAPTQMPEFADGVTFMKMYNEAKLTRDPFSQTKYSQDKIEGTKNGLNPYVYPNVDWHKTMFKDFSMNQRANLNVRGGSEKIQYYLSASVFHDNGILKVPGVNDFNKNIDIKRYNFRNNITVNLSPTTKVDLKMTALLEDYNGPKVDASEIFGNIMYSNPVAFPVTFPDQNGGEHTMFGNKSGGFFGGAYLNPYAEMLRGYKGKFSSTLFSNMRIDQKLDFITKGLSVNGLVSFKNMSSTSITRSMEPFFYEIKQYGLNDETNQYDYTLSKAGDSGKTSLDYKSKVFANRTMYIQSSMNYNREFKTHAVSGMLVYNQKEFSNGNPGEFNQSLPYRTQGVAGRFTYSFDDRYFMEYNFGYNGSENFISGKRFGFFPSYAMGYIVSNEKYFENLKSTISLFKLKASYGLVGNDQIGSGRFPYLDNVNLKDGDRYFRFGQNFDNERDGVSVNAYGNPDATWEVGRKINIGLELGLFDKVSLQADVFREIRSGIFMKRAIVPSTVGIGEASPYANIGKVENKGFDASLEYNDVFGDFIISLKGTFTYATNKVLERDEPTRKYPYKSGIGRPINQLRGLDAERLFIDQAEVDNSPEQTFTSNVLAGDIKYRDVSAQYDGLSRIDVNDEIPMGHPSVPEIVYGFGASMKYKKLDFSLFFQGITNVSFFISNIQPFAQNDRNVLKAIADDYWTEGNQNIHAFYPRLSATENTNNSQKSSKWLQNGGFLRLKNVEIGYTFNKLRVFMNGTNLLTFSKFDLWDPEMGGGNGLGYPPQKVFNIGAQMNF